MPNYVSFFSAMITYVARYQFLIMTVWCKTKKEACPLTIKNVQKTSLHTNLVKNALCPSNKLYVCPLQCHVLQMLVIYCLKINPLLHVKRKMSAIKGCFDDSQSSSVISHQKTAVVSCCVIGCCGADFVVKKQCRNYLENKLFISHVCQKIFQRTDKSVLQKLYFIHFQILWILKYQTLFKY